MSLANTTQSYGSLTKVFHWVTAALIIAIIPLGLIANKLPYDTDAQLATKAWLFSIHKTLGVLVFFVALLRILWAWSQPKPGPLHPDRRAETFLADLVHWLLYGSLVLAPLSGWIHHAATTGFAPIWWPFGQSLPFVPKDNGVAEIFGQLHWIWTKVMGISVFLHIAGALKHQIIDKDATLGRMWFGKIDAPNVSAHLSKLSGPLIAGVIFVASGAAITLAAPEETHTDSIALAEVSSGWEVLGGSLQIAIEQFGSRVTGEFADWTADISFDPETRSGTVEVVIAIGSLTLGSVTDQALGAPYFEAAAFPSATFTGPITHVADTQYTSAGTLTLKGVSADVVLNFGLTESDGSWSMDGGTTLDRRDYGIGEPGGGDANLGFPVEVTATVTAKQVNE